MRKQASAVWASAMIVRRRGPRKHEGCRWAFRQATRNKAALHAPLQLNWILLRQHPQSQCIRITG